MKLFSLLETSSEFFLLSAFRLSRMFKVPKMFCFCSILCVDVAFVRMCAFLFYFGRTYTCLAQPIAANRQQWGSRMAQDSCCMSERWKTRFYLSTLDIWGNILCRCSLIFCFSASFFFCLFGGLFLVWVGSRLAESLGVLGIFVLLHETLDSMHQW